MSSGVNRRQFVAASASAGVGMALTGSARAADKPAFLGGKPVRTKGYQSWPLVDAADENAVLEVVRARRWYRNRSVAEFEETYAKLNEAKYCVATTSGTSALLTSLGALGIGPGDEVIVPPYTFKIITYNDTLPPVPGPLYPTDSLEILKVQDVFKLQVSNFIFDCLHLNTPTNFHNWFSLKHNIHNYNTRSNFFDIEIGLNSNNLFIINARTTLWFKIVKIII